MQCRLLLLIIFLLSLTGLWAQPPATEVNRTDAKGRKQGAWVKHWDNGMPRYEGQFIDDRPQGTFRYFDDKGKATSEVVHAGDGVVSRAWHFHPDGSLLATGKYLGQQKDSVWNYYGGNGKLRKVERYQAGQLDGDQVSYYANGQVAERETRLKGQLHGPHSSWFESGKLKSESTYVNGEAEGTMVFYFPNGKKEIEGKVVNGNRDGVWFYFNDDGTIQLQMLYASGVLKKERKENGLFKEYYDDEQLMSEVTYKKGKREGAFKEYHDNGTWLIKPLPADPISGAPADMDRVLEGQTVKRTGTYVNDLLEGEVKEFDAKGKVVKVTRYLAGVEQP
jgi:antitoxin component YwqK of YwqJK toxin-antitoxin module